MKCSAKEGKFFEMFGNRGKMLRNVQQKRENALECTVKERKCSAKEGKCYEMCSKRGKML